MTADRFTLRGRTALVTGARTGIGQAIAVALAEAGADLVLHGHHDDLDETEALVEAVGARPARWIADLSEPEAVRESADRLAAELRITILVNNAGVISRGPAAGAGYDDWQRVLRTNLDSAFVLSQAFGRQMVERGTGKIIMVASLLSFQGGINVAGYTASKHALVGLTRALANEWAASGVQVNAIAPGYVATNNTAALRADAPRYQEILSRIPTGRWAVPEDIAGPAVFLASPASDYVTGHVLAVDGGWLSR